MKAVVMTKFGTPEVLRVSDLPKPNIKDDEVLIKVNAAGLNRLDHYIREGSVNPELSFPHVLGSDAVGTIAELGKGVKEFSVGDKVIAMPGYPLDKKDDNAAVLSASPSYAIRGLIEQGAYAQYIAVPARWVLKHDIEMTDAQLATLPMTLVTGMRAIKHVAKLRKGQRIFIHSGASGTGSVMIQIAKALGAEVATSIRTEEKRAFVESLGADLVVTTSDLADSSTLATLTKGKQFDVVVDNLGGASTEHSLNILKPLGVLVLMGNVLGLESTINVRSVFFAQREIRGTLMGDKADLEEGLQLVKAGLIKTSLDKTFTFEQAKEAHEYLATGKALGNIVFAVEH